MELYRTIKPHSRCLVNARVAKYYAFEFLPTHFIFFNTLHVFPFEDMAHFALLQSSIHTSWASIRSSSVGVTSQYTPNDCFVTFPFPNQFETGAWPTSVGEVGESYHKLRTEIRRTRKLSLTDLYNLFHDPGEKSEDIARLRVLHVEMDKAVVAAYDWSHLDLVHGFHDTKQGVRYTISNSARRIVLDRLLALNHQRYEEEVKAGLHNKKGESSPRRRYTTETVETPLAAEQSELFNNKS